MIGLRSRTISPSSVTSSRSTPCVAGWCGPMLSVRSSWPSSPPVASTSVSGAVTRSIGASVIDSSISRYVLIARNSFPSPRQLSSSNGSMSFDVRRPVGLVDGEHDRLAADREVAALGVALVVLGHQDPAQIGVALEDHAEHVVD